VSPDPLRPSAPASGAASINFTMAHPARIYDYLLGGATNFAVDREAAERGSDAVGGFEAAQAQVRGQRRFLGRAVRYLAEAGMRQFLDIGTGIPNDDNVHRVAQDAAPESRVVYVDNDPIVLAHAHTLLASTPEGATDFVLADLCDPEQVLAGAAHTLDFTRPVAVVLVGILHLVPDEDRPYELVGRLMDAVPAGSYLAISHMAKDIEPEAMAELVGRMSGRTGTPWTVRTRGEVTRFFDGLALVPPGVVPMDRWPEPEAPTADYKGGAVLPGYGAVARKP
jgi:hypothetical protein